MDIVEETILNISAVPKHFNKLWFTGICKDTINKALERFKHEPTDGSLNAYCMARARACRDIRHSKKSSWRNSSS